MRFFLYLCASTSFCASLVPAAGNVVISEAASQNVACSAGVCSPTTANAVLNVGDLENLLASGNTTVTTTSSGVQANDIVIDAPLTWSAATTLALDAFHSIRVDRRVSVAGAGTVSLAFDDGGSGGEFACGNRGQLRFANLSSSLAINGAPYLLVRSVAALASAIAANPSGFFALATDYDATKDGTYAASPVATEFSGSFNGLGNTISNLSINDPTENDNVGLFGITASSSALANVRLVSENVQGGSGTSQSPNEVVGGLAGTAGGAVAHSFVTGTVSGGDYAAVGGLLGTSEGDVTGSGSAAAVSAGVYGPAGGLIGLAGTGSINQSWATGAVTGSGLFVGGLVGFNFHPDIEYSWASGQVSGTGSSTTAGGLVGVDDYGIIEKSYAIGAVSCQDLCGGLLGWAGNTGGTPRVSQSYAAGNVTANASGNSGAGGLVGYNQTGEILDSYASGAVTAGVAGGLVGQNNNVTVPHSIFASYSTGTVTSTGTDAGGLVGYDYLTSTIKHAYWDMTTSGITDPGQGAGNLANDPGIKGLTDSKLKSGLPRGFRSSVWNESSSINGGLPYLISNPPQN